MNLIKKLLLFCLLFPTLMFAGLVEFKGYYQGKNLFLENDFLSDFNHHCITNVYVNSKHLLDHPEASIVEVDLSSFTIGDTLNFRIYHKKECKPRFVNKKDVEIPSNHFNYTKLTINEKNIHWETKGEEKTGKFSLQQMINNKWKDVKFIRGVGTQSVNTYTTPSHHLAGANTYRIKYRSSTGLVVYSKEVNFESQKSKVIFFPKRVVDFITFESEDDREIEYEVYNLEKEFLFKGKGVLLDCRSLEHSQYYILKYENKEERFYKKEGGVKYNKG